MGAYADVVDFCFCDLVLLFVFVWRFEFCGVWGVSVVFCGAGGVVCWFVDL